MGSNISIEIGTHSIRGAVMINGKPHKIPLGYPSSPYSCPSVAAKHHEGNFIFGDYANDFRFCSYGEFYHIADIEPSSDLYCPLYKGLANYISERLKRYGYAHPSSCTIIVPTFWGTVDPRKTKIENSFKAAGIDRISFIPDIVALCRYNAFLEENSPVIAFDFGYSGTTISIIKREGDRIAILATVRKENIGGRAINGILLKRIDSEKSLSTNSLTFPPLLLLEKQAECAERINEELSFSETVSQSFITDIYTLNRQEFFDMTKHLFISAIQSCKEILAKANLSFSNISKVLICGGCSNIPFIEDLVNKFFIGNCNKTIGLKKISEGADYSYYQCFGALYSNDDEFSITL